MTHRLFIAARAALAVALLALAACDSPEERVQKHFDRGMELAASNDADRALIELRNALKLDPNHVPSRFEIAKLFEARGEFQAAANNYRAAAEFDPSHVEARLRLAQLLSLGGAAETALDWAAEATELAPESADTLSTEAAIRYRLEQTDAAVALARRAVALDPAALGANVVLITQQMREGDPAGGVARIDALLASAPRERTLLLLKAQILAEAGDQPALGAHLEHLAALFPEEDAFRRELASWHASQGDVDAAAAELRAIAAARADDPQAALDVARLLAGARGAAAARAEVDALLAAADSSVKRIAYSAALADLDWAAGDRAAARARLEGVLADDDASVAANAARIQLARYAREDGDGDRARALVEKVLETDARNVEARAFKAGMLIDADRPDEAVAEIRVALEADPQNVRLLLVAAQAQERAGNADLAAVHLAEATRLSGFAPAVAGTYARFLVGRGQAEAAESILAEAARRAPQDAGALAALADLRIRLGDWAGVEAAAAALAQIEGAAPAATRARAVALSGRNELAESARLLEGLAAEEDRAAAAVLPNLIATYLRLGEAERARETLDGILTEKPDDLTALLLRAELHLFEGQSAEAGNLLRAAVAAEPRSPAPHLALHRFGLATGDAELIDAALTEGIAQVPPEAAGSLRLARAGRFELAGDFAGAIAEYEALYALQPGSAVVANNLASLIAETQGDDAEAVDRAARVAQRLRGSSEPHFQDTWGWIEFLQGRPEAALKALVPAAEALPNNPLVRYHAGRAHAAVGE
ncbi:MAG: tetratricopeptide repeat protein, partial [Rubrimonas sp.]